MNVKILVVDDNPENIQVVSTCLSKSGYNVEFTLNGMDAIKWIEEADFDLILLDVMMPEVDGFEVCKKIKKIPGKSDIPVIFLTAKTDLESISNGFDAGGVDYIEKPFFEKELLARVATHLKIQSQSRELIYQNSFKSILMSVIAHDLRTPLSIISNMISVLKIKKNQQKIEEYGDAMDIIETSIKESFNIVNDLLVWGKVQFGKIKINPSSFNLFVLINEITALFSSVLVEKNIKIFNNVQTDLLIKSDRSLLKIVLKNLLYNAIKFTNINGEIQVFYEIFKNDSYLINVKDSGIGINKMKLQELFTSYQKHIPVNTYAESDMGLGLFLCKDITEFLNGSVSVESEEGKGSTFKINFPLK